MHFLTYKNKCNTIVPSWSLDVTLLQIWGNPVLLDMKVFYSDWTFYSSKHKHKVNREEDIERIYEQPDSTPKRHPPLT